MTRLSKDLEYLSGSICTKTLNIEKYNFFLLIKDRYHIHVLYDGCSGSNFFLHVDSLADRHVYMYILY